MTLFIENNFVLTLEALYWLDDLKTAKVSDLTPTSYQQIEPKYPKIGLKLVEKQRKNLIFLA